MIQLSTARCKLCEFRDEHGFQDSFRKIAALVDVDPPTAGTPPIFTFSSQIVC